MKQVRWRGRIPRVCEKEGCDVLIGENDVCYVIRSRNNRRYYCKECGESLEV